MKKIIILFIITFLLVSCNNNEKSIVKDTTEIVNDYADTLESSVIDAKAATELINQNQQKLSDDLKNIY